MPIADGTTWGNWRFDADKLTLDFESEEVNVGTEAEPEMERRERYYIQLLDIQTPAAMLDWIFHVREKPWGDAAVTSLIDAFEELFHPRSTLCGGGVHREIEDVRRLLVGDVGG